MNTKAVSLLCIPIFVLSLIGCKTAVPGYRTLETAICSYATVASAPAPTILPTDEHLTASRTDAVPLGETGTVGLVDFIITEMVRPATDKILTASSANPEPEEGMEYVLVDLVEVCALPVYNECYIRISDMRLIGSSGIVRRPKNVVGLPFMMPNRHIFGGTTAYGYVAFIVDQTEEDLVFYYERQNEGIIYLATE